MTVAREREIEIPYGTIAAREWGEPGAQPVLAVHGWLDNAASFDALAPLIPRVHLVAIDLPGHGRSSHRPVGNWYHFVDYLSDVASVVDALGWTRFTLLGHSLGGTLASLFAALYPERVGELMLVEALGPLSTGSEQSLAQLRRALDDRDAFVRRRPLRVFAEVEEAMAARMRANALSEAAARAIVTRGLVKVEGGLVWSSDPRLTLASPQRYTEQQVLAMLGGIRARSLLVLADPPTSYLPSAMMDERAAQVAGIRVVRLPGGHHLHLEDAQAVATQILAFASPAGAVQPRSSS